MMYRIRAGHSNDSLYLSEDTKGLTKQNYGLWKTQKAARNVIETLKSTKTCRHLTTQAIDSLVVEEATEYELPDIRYVSTGCQGTDLEISDPEELISSAELYRLVSDVSEFSAHRAEYADAYSKVIKQEDEAIMDILHFIEMNEITEENAMSYISAIRSHRKRRREAKDGLYLLDTMRGYLEGRRTTKKKIDRYLKERTYRPRILQNSGNEYA